MSGETPGISREHEYYAKDAIADAIGAAKINLGSLNDDFWENRDALTILPRDGLKKMGWKSDYPLRLREGAGKTKEVNAIAENRSLKITGAPKNISDNGMDHWWFPVEVKESDLRDGSGQKTGWVSAEFLKTDLPAKTETTDSNTKIVTPPLIPPKTNSPKKRSDVPFITPGADRSDASKRTDIFITPGADTANTSDVPFITPGNNKEGTADAPGAFITPGPDTTTGIGSKKINPPGKPSGAPDLPGAPGGPSTAPSTPGGPGAPSNAPTLPGAPGGPSTAPSTPGGPGAPSNAPTLPGAPGGPSTAPNKIETPLTLDTNKFVGFNQELTKLVPKVAERNKIIRFIQDNPDLPIKNIKISYLGGLTSSLETGNEGIGTIEEASFQDGKLKIPTEEALSECTSITLEEGALMITTGDRLKKLTYKYSR